MYKNVACDWINVNKGTTQGGVSGPYLFGTFINDLQNQGLTLRSLRMQMIPLYFVPFWKEGDSNTAIHVVNITEWSINNCINCNFFPNVKKWCSEG